jgi:hypothetical protein
MSEEDTVGWIYGIGHWFIQGLKTAAPGPQTAAKYNGTPAVKEAAPVIG